MKFSVCEMCQSSRGGSSSLPTAATKKGTKQKYHEIVFFCQKSGDPFVDDSFPPAPKSLYYNPKPSGSGDLVTQWLRPKDIVTEQGGEDSKWVVFRTPLPSDISQGACQWWLCFRNWRPNIWFFIIFLFCYRSLGKLLVVKRTRGYSGAKRACREDFGNTWNLGCWSIPYSSL